MKKLILKAIAGNLVGEEFIFTEHGPYVIGRSKSCALHIPNEKDMKISRRHLLLVFDDRQIRIRDLGSKNGTTLNKTVLTPGNINTPPEKETPADKEVIHGDYISLGDTVFLTKILPGEETFQEAPIPLAKEQATEKKKSPVSKILGSIVKKSTLPSSEKQDLDDAPTMPIKTLPPRQGRKAQVAKSTTPLVNLDNEKKTTLEIKEKQPPVAVPVQLKKNITKKQPGRVSKRISDNPHLATESATTLMNQDELEELMNIDDTQFQVPEKLKKASVNTLSPGQ